MKQLPMPFVLPGREQKIDASCAQIASHMTSQQKLSMLRQIWLQQPCVLQPRPGEAMKQLRCGS